MDKRIPFSIMYLFDMYINLLKHELGDYVYGVYVYGSIATGAFDVNKSDIDFMTVVKGELTRDRISRLKAIHRELLDKTIDGVRMEGEYVNLFDIMNGKPAGKYPYFAQGEFHEPVNLKYMTLYQIKEFGIKVYGGDFSEICGEIGWPDVEGELKGRLENYWLARVNSRSLLMFDSWVALVTLNVCRLHYALENQRFTSKTGGGEYALRKLPEEWHELVREALRIQEGTSKTPLAGSRWHRAKKTREFVRYIAELYNCSGRDCLRLHRAAV